VSTLATEDDVEDDGADNGEKDHDPYREIEGELTPPEYQVAWQPVHTETTEQKEHSTEHEQHECAPDQHLSYAFESHDPILCPPRPMSTRTTRPLGSGGLFVVELGEEALNVQGPRHHCEPAFLGARPLLLRTVAVQLDAVAVWIPQVQSLGDAVV
jgi:hypothetical protein